MDSDHIDAEAMQAIRVTAPTGTMPRLILGTHTIPLEPGKSHQFVTTTGRMISLTEWKPQ